MSAVATVENTSMFFFNYFYENFMTYLINSKLGFKFYKLLVKQQNHFPFENFIKIGFQNPKGAIKIISITKIVPILFHVKILHFL